MQINMFLSFSLDNGTTVVRQRSLDDTVVVPSAPTLQEGQDIFPSVHNTYVISSQGIPESSVPDHSFTHSADFNAPPPSYDDVISHIERSNPEK
jgi:hypothetical protein